MPDSSIPSDVRDLATQLAEPRLMRRGSVSERYVKCNRPGCPCGERAEARHGPYYSVSRVVKGRTQSRWLSAERAQQVCQQIEAGQQFRKCLELYWQACERWADAELNATSAASEAEAARRGASKPPSKRRSSPRSKRS